MKLQPSRMHRWVGAALVAVVTAAVGNVARAADVHWSIGVNAAPGVVIGASNARPYYYAPAPVYVAPAPVYYAPPAPVYYTQGYYPAYYGPTVIYGGSRHIHRPHRHHHRHRH